ncbi:hypothetical protein GOBAR_AA34755 [Gossypium barbadense]|uniref:Uncharacterized protein n=1 Tax=Gossypium barbadense TaxID=3634 RepID=A0A2P5W4E9_GOSBA|nr:hypothetical protein GOBAR_AA34755 [Gossypium barbadense]
MGGGAWPFLVGGAICLVNSVNERDLSLLTSYTEIIAIFCLQRGIPSKCESSGRVDYVPALFKKLVVRLKAGLAGPPHSEHRSARPYCRRCPSGLNWSGRSFGAVTLKKLETLPAPYEKSKSSGSGGSMVARLKLKGIDGRAPPGVEPAT